MRSAKCFHSAQGVAMKQNTQWLTDRQLAG